MECSRHMKITGIETLVCHARMRNWVFVKVVTDQPGLFGWGEATLEWHTRGVVGSNRRSSHHLLIGEDPTRVEHLWQMMWRQHFWHGSGSRPIDGDRRNRSSRCGISSARLHGVPCHKLWGGPVRDSIRLYCHLGGGNLESFYETPVDNAKAVCRPGSASGRRWIHGLQVHGGAAHDADRRTASRSRLPMPVWPPCVKRSETTLTSWSIAMRDRRRRWACSSPKLSNRTGSYFSGRTLLAGEHRRPGGDQRSRHDTDCHRRTTDAPGRVSRSVCRSRLRDLSAGYHSLRWLHGSTPHRRSGRCAIASRWLRTIRRGRSARPPRWNSGFLSRVTSSANRCTTMCRGEKTSSRKDFVVDPATRTVTPNTRPGWEFRSTKTKCASIRSSRRFRNVSSIAMAASEIGNVRQTIGRE